jgi:hypothetical protein
MGSLLAFVLNLSAVVACASAVMTVGERSTRAYGAAESLWVVGLVPAAAANPTGAVVAAWRSSWRRPNDGGPGRVPYRQLRRLELSRPIHAP